MNKTPSILVDTGFEVDQNGALTEIVTPNVVATLNAPRKVTFNGTTLNYVPSTAAALQEFVAPNATSATGNLFNNYTALNTLKLNSVTGLSTSERNFCYGCTSLVTLQMDNIVSISTYVDGSGTFRNCTSLVNVSLPKLQTISTANQAGVFHSCTSLETLNLPSFSVSNSEWNGGLCNNCTSLTSVTLGSEGHPVTSLTSATFSHCTQSTLTITIYTQGGASLANSPWGATNADIEYEEA